MKQIRNILIRVIVLFTAIQVLNVSVDVDYIEHGGSCFAHTEEYDDIDSFVELLLEKVTGDNHYIAEDDDDNGNPLNKGLEKYDTGTLYYEQAVMPGLCSRDQRGSYWLAGLDLANRTCQGYHNILTPPPDRA